MALTKITEKDIAETINDDSYLLLTQSDESQEALFRAQLEKVKDVITGDVSTELQSKATIETGSLPSNNYAWYANDSTKTLTGSYEIIGDYIFITATAYRIADWGVVYYTLPMTPLGACASTAFESDTNYTIQTNTLTSEGVTYPVVQIRATDGSTMTEGTIMFTMMYKVS